jgi:hypothetical protein
MFLLIFITWIEQQKLKANFKKYLFILRLKFSVRMYHNGSRDPMLFLDMDTVGKFNEIKNPGYTKEFMEFLTENFNLKMNRYFLKLAFNNIIDLLHV